MTQLRVVLLVGASHVVLFLLLCVALVPGESLWEGAMLATFATLLVFNAVAMLIFFRAFRRTLIPGFPMSFILGARPEDANERWAWYWGRASWATVFTVLVAGFTLMGWKAVLGKP